MTHKVDELDLENDSHLSFFLNDPSPSNDIRPTGRKHNAFAFDKGIESD